MNRKGFTMIEMIFSVSIILIILLLVIPNITHKHKVIKEKGCTSQLEVVNSQILLFEVENGRLPTSVSELTSSNPPYLTDKQIVCPNDKKINIKDGQAYVE